MQLATISRNRYSLQNRQDGHTHHHTFHEGKKGRQWEWEERDRRRREERERKGREGSRKEATGGKGMGGEDKEGQKVEKQPTKVFVDQQVKLHFTKK